MDWTIHTSVGGDPTAFSFDGQTLRPSAEPPWSPPEGAFGWTVPGPRGPRLTFHLSGEGPTYDLLVRQGSRRLVVTGLDVTHEVFAWLEPMDGACLLTGEPGHEKAQRIIVLSLAPL